MYKETGWKAREETVDKISEFPLSGGFMEKGAEGSSKDRASSGRVISQDRIYSNQSEMGQQKSSEILQQKGNLRTVDKGRQICPELEKAQLSGIHRE